MGAATAGVHLVRSQIKDKPPPLQYSLYQDCGSLPLISQCREYTLGRLVCIEYHVPTRCPHTLYQNGIRRVPNRSAYASRSAVLRLGMVLRVSYTVCSTGIGHGATSFSTVFSTAIAVLRKKCGTEIGYGESPVLRWGIIRPDRRRRGAASLFALESRARGPGAVLPFKTQWGVCLPWVLN
eukprot:2101059-Rhodomonas_salina.1